MTVTSYLDLESYASELGIRQFGEDTKGHMLCKEAGEILADLGRYSTPENALVLMHRAKLGLYNVENGFEAERKEHIGNQIVRELLNEFKNLLYNKSRDVFWEFY